MSPRADEGRYFFAVWPQPPIRDELAAWSGEIGADKVAKRVPADNLHITLAFLGTLVVSQVEAARRVAAATTWKPTVLELDRIGYWKRSRIIWAGPRQGCEPLSGLAEGLRDGLRRVGFRIDARPFVPHVTLFRKARRRPKWASRMVSWPIEEFCLVCSRLSAEGARYEILDRWSATGDVE